MDDSKIINWDTELKSLETGSIVNFYTNAENSLKNLKDRFKGVLASASVSAWDDKVKSGISERAELIGSGIDKQNEMLQKIQGLDGLVNTLKEKAADYVIKNEQLKKFNSGLPPSLESDPDDYYSWYRQKRTYETALNTAKNDAYNAANAIISKLGGDAITVPSDIQLTPMPGAQVNDDVPMGERRAEEKDNYVPPKKDTDETATPTETTKETATATASNFNVVYLDNKTSLSNEEYNEIFKTGTVVKVNGEPAQIAELEGEKIVIYLSNEINGKNVYESFDNLGLINGDKPTVIEYGDKSFEVTSEKTLPLSGQYTDAKDIHNGTVMIENLNDAVNNKVEVYKTIDTDSGKTDISVKYNDRYFGNKTPEDIRTVITLDEFKNNNFKDNSYVMLKDSEDKEVMYLIKQIAGTESNPKYHLIPLVDEGDRYFGYDADKIQYLYDDVVKGLNS